MTKIGSLAAKRETPPAVPTPTRPTKAAKTATPASKATASQIAKWGKPPSHGGCPPCRKRGYEKWEWHSQEQCFTEHPELLIAKQKAAAQG